MSGSRHTTGEAQYTDDLPPPPGTLHGWLVRAAKAPATIEFIDASAAKGAKGVEAVLFASDLPEGGINAMGPLKQDEWCFAEGVVEHVGQVIGIVVARTLEDARLASQLVEVTYGPPPAGVTPCYTIADAIKCGSLWDDKLGFDSRHDVESGPPVEQALAQPGLTVVSGEFCIGGQEHFYLEPQASIVQPSDDGGLHVVSSSQDPFTVQKYCAKVTGLPLHKVVSKVKRIGGGFGGKETRAAFACACAAVAAYTLQRPVSLTLRRDVDMGVTGGRHPFYAKYTAAAKLDPSTNQPRLAALDVQLYSNGGAMLDVSSAVMDRALTHIDNCYKWPSFRARGVVCKTHTPPNTAFRGFGAPQGMLTCEHILEHLASAMLLPSDALRVANLYQPEDEVPFGETLPADEWRVPRAMAELRRSADVDARRSDIEAFNKANRWRKRGLAFVPTKYGIAFGPRFMNQGGALVHIYTDGTILISHGGTEMGQGLHTKVCQVAARALGVPLSACHVAETASDKVPNAITTAGSMSTELYGMAVLDACRQLVHRLQPLREKLGAGASLAQLATAAWFSRIDLCAHGYFSLDGRRCGFDFGVKPGVKPDGTPDQTTRGNLHNYYTQGVGCVEVEIDVLTGDHEVLRADMLVDLGSSINPALDIGQIEGGFTQGMGWTTTEELIWGDEEHAWVKPGGRLHTSGPGTYKIPAFNDTPRQFNVQLMSGVDNKVAIHSSKAVGEPPFFIGAVVFIAIRNAVAAARMDHLKTHDGDGASGSLPAGALPHVSLYSPATSERIRMACGDRFAALAIGDEAANRKDALIVKGSF